MSTTALADQWADQIWFFEWPCGHVQLLGRPLAESSSLNADNPGTIGPHAACLNLIHSLETQGTAFSPPHPHVLLFSYERGCW